MNTILTVMRKELTATLRDKKTLVSAIIIPALAVPLLILGITKLQMSLIEKEEVKRITVALVDAPPALDAAFRDSSITLVRNASAAAARDSVAAERYAAAVLFDTAGGFSSRATLVYKSTEGVAADRVEQKLDAYEQSLVRSGLAQRAVDTGVLHPLAVQRVDVASGQEQFGQMAGGFVPYIFIIFCFLGCLYPSLDIITGEKEKGTIETLLTTPAARFQILLGKVLAIATVGIAAAVMAIAGMAATLRLMGDIPPEILSAISNMLSARFLIMLFAMLLPLVVFFAGLLSAIAIRASTFKEAQSYVTPLTFVVIIPAMVALMPGVELTWGTAAVPVLNIALATKEIIAGTIHTGMYAVVVASLVALALLAVVASRGQFSKEGNILK